MEKNATNYLVRKEVEALTGLDYRAIRRLEKARLFPRRMMARGTEQAGKVRWHRDAVEKWIEADEQVIRTKVITENRAVGFVENSGQIVQCFARPGFKFIDAQSHCIEFQFGGLRMWSGMWNHRDLLRVQQCHCCINKSPREEPVVYQAGEKDVRRYK